MNTAARTIYQSVVTPKRLMNLILSRSYVPMMTLLVLVICSALFVIYLTNKTRDFNIQLQLAQEKQEQLNIQWSQLLLEKSSWQSQSHVIEIATNALGMAAPEEKRYIVLNQ